MRICMITTFYPPYSFGGDGMFVYQLSNALARRGHEIHVIHCIDSYRMFSPEPEHNNYPNEDGVYVYGLTSGLGKMSPLLTYLTGYPCLKIKRVKEILESADFDLINYHNISLIGGPAILKYGQAVKLYTIHEHWLVCPTHVLLKYGQKVCSKKNCISCTLSYRRPPQLWRYTGLMKSAVKHVDAFLAPNQFTLKKHLEDGLDIPALHFPHGMMLPDLEDKEDISLPEGVPDRPFVLFAGRLEKLKGLQTLIPVFQGLGGVDLVIAGRGTYEEDLKSQAAGNPRVHFLGQLTPDELFLVYQKALAVVVPSIAYETFGLVAVEAFAARTPVIVRNMGGLPELIKTSQGGFVYDTEQDLVACIDRLLNDEDLRTRLGENGYRAYRQRWTMTVYVDRYLELVEGLGARKNESVSR